MGEETRENIIKNSISNATNENLLKEIPSRISHFNLYDDKDRESIIYYLKLINNEISFRENLFGENCLIDCLNSGFCENQLIPRWIVSFKISGYIIFDVLQEAGMLERVIVQLSKALNCDMDINTIVQKLFNNTSAGTFMKSSSL